MWNWMEATHAPVRAQRVWKIVMLRYNSSLWATNNERLPEPPLSAGHKDPQGTKCGLRDSRREWFGLANLAVVHCCAADQERYAKTPN